jgi:curved DNA-binding protein CbpA
MKLDPSATTEAVKAQFRKLRAEYFASDASKYRQLQTAYAVLVDGEARREYDELYRASRGLPALASESASEKSADTSSTSAGSVSSLRGSVLVKAAVSRIDAQSQDGKIEEQRRREEEEQRRHEEEEEQRRREEGEEQRRRAEEEERRRAEEEEQHHREADPNWGLKHFSPLYEPLIGSEPYHSFVPVAAEYELRTTKTRSRRPTYVGEIAVKAAP